MRNRSSKWTVACLLLTAVAGPAQQANTNASVAGRVTDSATGKPIPHAHVSMYPGGGRQHYGALTDAGGEVLHPASCGRANMTSPPLPPDSRRR